MTSSSSRRENSAGGAAAAGPMSSGRFTFDVTDSLQAWLADPESNLGWAFLPFDSDGWGIFSAETERLFLPRLIVNYVPEPGTLVMLMAGLIGLGVAVWRRRRA